MSGREQPYPPYLWLQPIPSFDTVTMRADALSHLK